MSDFPSTVSKVLSTLNGGEMYNIHECIYICGKICLDHEGP